MRLLSLSFAAVLAAGSAVEAQCPTFGPFVVTGALPTNLSPPGTLSEVSGLVVSRLQPGVIWMHDDQGHGPIIAGVRADGSVVQHYFLFNVASVDWEDIALGPGPLPGRDYLYIGDIGEGSGSRTQFALIRVPEPSVPAAPGPIANLAAEVFPFQYPGAPADAEALFVDPVDGSPYLVTKASNHAFLYRYPLPLDTAVTRTLVLVGALNLPAHRVTGADITGDGSCVYLRTRTQVLAFPRARGNPIGAAMSGAPCVIFTGDQGQAEAIGIEPDGRGLYTVAEGAGSPILRAPAPTLPVYPAWWCYGTGVDGMNGALLFGPDRPPLLGGTGVQLRLHGGRAATPALAALSTLSIPMGRQPLAGGYLLVEPWLLFFIALDGLGAGIIPLPPAPPEPVLVGVELHAQTFVADAASSGGIAMTRRLTLRFGF